MISLHRTPTRRHRRLRRSLLVVVAGLIVVMVASTTVVEVRRHLDRALPEPEPTWPVGRVELELIDGSRTDPTDASGQSSARRVGVWVWYPARSTAHDVPAEYAPGSWAALHLAGPMGQLEGDFTALHPRAIEHAGSAGGRFPLVVFEPGMGFSGPQYQSLAESMAAAGAVVAAITPTHSANVAVLDKRIVGATPAGNPPDLGSHRGSAASQARGLVDLWAGDAVFVSHHLLTEPSAVRAHLLPGTVYMGHSFGGAASLQACSIDRGCRGAVDLDGTQFGTVVDRGIAPPIMIMESADSCITGVCGPQADDNADDRAVARSLLDHSPGPRWCFTIDGARHFDFTDYPAYYLAAPLRTLLPLGSIDGHRVLAITEAYLIAFVARDSSDGRRALLDDIETTRYPEIHPACP